MPSTAIQPNSRGRISARPTRWRMRHNPGLTLPSYLAGMIHSPYSAASFQVSRWVFGFALRRKSRHSSRSRVLLRKICSLPAKYCGGQWMALAPYQAAAFMVKYGSTRCGRGNLPASWMRIPATGGSPPLDAEPLDAPAGSLEGVA